MKVAFLEHRPVVLWDAVERLKTMGATEIIMIYYHGDMDTPSMKKEVQERCGQLGVEIVDVKYLGFQQEMDKVYKDQDVVFFFHMRLPGDHSQYFSDQLSVSYAKKKQDDGERRIWFYTTAGMDDVNMLNSIFENRCIPVLDLDTNTNQYVFDYDFIRENVPGLNHG